jgi:2-methylcitrate dehydratase
MIPGILAVGEALHSTGTEIMMATCLAYEILWSIGQAAVHHKVQLDGPYEGMATALACGKLMGLNEDKLANALTLAMVPHQPMFVSHVGALSHWKGCHSGMGVREGVFAAQMAREGMTGPSMPFEGRSGLWDVFTGPFDLKIPRSSDGKLLIEDMGFKRFPGEGSTQGILDQFIPQLHAWAKPEEIESIDVEMPFFAWQEVGDPPKWDPKNRETADHSYAYVTAIGMIDGDVYIQSFKPERYLEDKRVRDLMEKITVRPNPEFEGLRKRLTVRKKSGEVLVKDLYDVRPMTHDDIVKKFNRICDYMSVSNGQRDRALATWSNLKTVKDIAEPIRDLANFGKPQPL